MPAPYGLLTTGLNVPTAAELKASFDEAFKAGPLGESAGTEPDGSIPAASNAGQEIAILVDAFSSLYQKLQAVNAGMNPESATGANLVAVGALTGVVKLPAAKSTVSAICLGVVGTLLQVGRVATVTGTGTRFATTAEATLAAIAATWQVATAYAVNDLVTNAGNAYVCKTAGTSAGVGPGPNTTGGDILDGTAHWIYVGADTIGAALVPFEAEDYGPLVALVESLVNIATPVNGWTLVSNLLAATPGRLLESDPAFRVRRQVELTSDGTSPVNAIRAAVLAAEVAGARFVTACVVFENTTDAPNADGLPPHSVEVLANAPVGAEYDQAIAEAIFNSVAAGIAIYGSDGPFAVVDDGGISHDVYYTRPTEIPIYIVATVYYDASVWTGATPAADVEAAAIGALSTFVAEYYQIGINVRVSPLNSAIMNGPTSTDPGATAAPGLVEVTPLYIGIAPAPGTAAPISIGLRELATFSPLNMTITALAEVP